jgi:hypothetical protein
MAAFVEAALPQVEQRFPATARSRSGHLGDGNVHFTCSPRKGAVRG